jgi:leader peptidase (prepilin peptidase)/N-methyltransferase
MAAALQAVTLAALLVAVTFTDLRARLIPNRLLALATLALLGIVVPADPGSLPERLAWASGAGVFHGLAHAARPDGMGLGDVKLAAVLGLFLGPAVATAMVVALSLGAAAGLLLRVREVPFAPFLATGTAVACLPLSTVGGWS